MQAVKINNLAFSYGKKNILKGFNLNIPCDSFSVIYGNTGTGKTTLAHILAGDLKSSGNILLFDKKLSLSKNVCVLFNDMDYYETDLFVIDMCADVIKGLSKEEAKNEILKVAREFSFTECLNFRFCDLSFDKKKLVLLGLAVIQDYKVLVLDNFLDGFIKKHDTLLKLKKRVRKKMTVIVLTNDIEDIFLADKFFVVDSGKIIISSDKKSISQKVSFFEDNNIPLPFILNLSNKLKFYNLTDKMYIDEKKLVDDLWK